MDKEPISGNTLGAMQYPDGSAATMTPPESVQPPQTPPTPPTINEPSTPKINLEEPTTSPTVISTDSLREQLKQGEDRLKAMQAEIEAGKIQEQPVEQPETTEQRPDTELSTADRYKSEIDNYTKETNKILNERKNQFNKYLTRSDNLLKSQVSSIQSSFDERREQANQVAQNAIAASNILGSRTGRLRYAPEIQRSITTGQENALIETLSTIDAQEAAAMAAAEESAFSRDYKTFLDQIDDLDTIKKERETTLANLEEAMKEENDRRREEAETAKQETQIIEQIAAGITDPIEVFTALDGNVPFDLIKEYTDSLPGGADEFEFKTGTKFQPAGTFNKTTGEFTPLSGASGSQVVGNYVAGGGSVAGTGGVGVPNFPKESDLKLMTTEERDFVNKVLRQLPTKLKDSEQEKTERQLEALFDYRRGRGIQEVVDELNGFVVENKNDQSLANVFRGYAVGSGVDLSEISAAINSGNPEQAMTTVENAKLSDAEQFFGSIDEARNIVKLSDTILNLLDEVPTDKLGAFDGRAFKIGRFANLTDEEGLKVQQLETALATLNSPVRVSLIGTAGTEQEMAKITALQADILDQPDIIETIVSQFRSGVLDIHNEARSQRGLPTVDRDQLISNEARLDLYRGKARDVEVDKFENMDTKTLFNSLPSATGDSTVASDNVFELIGLE